MTNIDLLIIGGSGFVGARLTEAAIRAGRQVAYTYSSHRIQLPAASFQVNLQDEKVLEACIAETRPRAIIYCAVPHPGSGAELHKAVSENGVRRLLAVLDRSNPCKFIYVSTNAVFSGKSGPYGEDDTPDPEERQDQYRAYAMTRARGEQIALDAWPETIVARTADVNGRGIQGKLNPRLQRLVEQLQAGVEKNRLCDGYISPTLVDNLVAALLEISRDDFEYRGVLHLAGSQQISYYDFARMVAREIKADEQLVTKDTSRAWNIALDTSYTQSILKTHLMDVQEQLSAIFP